MAEKSKTAKYYASNPEARKKRLKYQAEYNKKPEQVEKRKELVKKNRDDKTYGNGDGKDYDHATKRHVKASVNRGRNSKNGGTAGDKRARG
jgi:hypothetical protein